MKNKTLTFFLPVALILLILINPVRSISSDNPVGSPVFTVTQFPEEVLAGDALLVTLITKGKADKVTGFVYGNEVFFFKDDKDEMKFYAFVGTNINQKDDLTKLSLSVVFSSGVSMDYEYNIKIKEVEYPEEALTVDNKLVEPPKEESKRIKEERDEIIKIFSEPSNDMRFGSSFVLPINSEITSSFGNRRKYNGIKKSPHNGIDFKGGVGKEIKSTNDGKIVLAKDLYFTGNTVIIDHGLGVFSAYFHLSRIIKKVSDDVKKGDIIGTVGMTGRVTGPHLHFSVKLNGSYVNPLSFISLTEMIFNSDDVSAKNDLKE